MISFCAALRHFARRKLPPSIPKNVRSGLKSRGIRPAPLWGMDKAELQERSLAFAVAVTDLTRAMRDNPSSRSPADQLSRCASSVGANYRAACRARSRAEFVAKLGLVVEEIDEAVYWLQFVTQSKMVTIAESTRCLDEAQQLRAIFAASYGAARRNHQLAQKHRGRSTSR